MFVCAPRICMFQTVPIPTLVSCTYYPINIHGFASRDLIMGALIGLFLKIIRLSFDLYCVESHLHSHLHHSQKLSSALYPVISQLHRPRIVSSFYFIQNSKRKPASSLSTQHILFVTLQISKSLELLSVNPTTHISSLDQSVSHFFVSDSNLVTPLILF